MGIGWRSQPNRRVCHYWNLQEQSFTFCGWFVTASIFSKMAFNMNLIGSAACDQAWLKISTEKIEVIIQYVSLETQVSARCKWTAIHCNRWSSSTLGWYSRATQGGISRLIHASVKQTQFCESFVTLWWLKGSFQTPNTAKHSFSNRFLFRSSPIVMNLG